ncbi:hypothetical protein FE257_013049 [Aspergillus nanangensis]|uniref:Uncharacterized protein n=1 Tax=Aspergillus nanangensis TaxID=2582783 RepID=A0AAD4CGP1_ASPNN|nr:hypothetical protein FE257_013049 [Aspergillus nanangensis]
MATAEGPARAHDRNGRRRPFSSWMKRLANLKSSTESSTRWSNKRHAIPKSKGRGLKNNPYPLSGTTNFHEYNSDNTTSELSDDHVTRSCSQSAPSVAYSGYDNQVPATSTKSTAPTISTNGDTAISDAAYSKAGTLATAGGGISSIGGGEGSTFSSPAPSVRSLTTTLTTVQSAAPSGHLYNTQNTHHHHGPPHTHSTQSTQQVQFSHQFPPSPATAVPSHLVSHNHSVTYSTATANNILTDNASILTLASSSKRRRRNSLDTNASVRALAPSSVFGGSRESLPLSVLSGNAAEPSNTSSSFNTPAVLNRPSLVGLASAERISVYSSSGAAPLTTGGERGSFHANKVSPGAADGASIVSGTQSHSRHDSNSASISGAVTSGSQAMPVGRISRRSSGWGEIEIAGDETDDEKPRLRNDEGPDAKLDGPSDTMKESDS